MSLEAFGIIILVIILISLGISIFSALGLGMGLVILVMGTPDFVFLGDGLFTNLNSFVLIAVPLFILTGDVIVVSGLSKNLMEFADNVTMGLKTGIGTATVLGCGLFAAISGSNSADAAAIGRITYDDLRNYGYPGSYAGALVASGASTGILIPPSIVYIVAGFIFGISPSILFRVAFIPGVLVLISIMFVNIIINNANQYEQGSDTALSLRSTINATWEAKLALAIPFIILGGIYSGIFTPTESAAVAVGVAVLFSLPQGRLSLSEFPEMLERSALINGLLAPILAVALTLGEMFSLYGIPRLVVNSLLGLTTSYTGVILIMFLILVVSGALIETGPLLVIFGPLFLPTAMEIGMHPVHYTVFLVSTLGVGFITPPFGLNLFVMAGVTGEDVYDIAYYAVPFAITLMIVCLIIAFVPGFYMWLL